MRLTPLDVRSHAFRSAWRGFDRTEVKVFLQLVADDYESLAVEADALRRRVQELEQRVEELARQEGSLRKALVSAQEVSEDLKRTAVREAEMLVAQAEVRAEKILDQARRRAGRIAADIREMKLIRSQIATVVRNSIETHLALLDSLAEESPEERLIEAKASYAAEPVEMAVEYREPPSGGA